FNPFIFLVQLKVEKQKECYFVLDERQLRSIWINFILSWSLTLNVFGWDQYGRRLLFPSESCGQGTISYAIIMEAMLAAFFLDGMQRYQFEQYISGYLQKKKKCKNLAIRHNKSLGKAMLSQYKKKESWN
ncbi:hypothetical protein Tsubulata_016017, partial [Turnera subulata]